MEQHEVTSQLARFNLLMKVAQKVKDYHDKNQAETPYSGEDEGPAIPLRHFASPK